MTARKRKSFVECVRAKFPETPERRRERLERLRQYERMQRAKDLAIATVIASNASLIASHFHVGTSVALLVVAVVFGVGSVMSR